MYDFIQSMFLPDKEVEYKNKEQNWENSSGVHINFLNLS